MKRNRRLGSYQLKALYVMTLRGRNFSIIQTRVSLPISNDRVFLECLKHLPSPLPIDRVVGNTKHQEETLHGFRTLQIVCIRRLDDEVFFPRLWIFATTIPRSPGSVSNQAISGERPDSVVAYIAQQVLISSLASSICSSF